MSPTVDFVLLTFFDPRVHHEGDIRVFFFFCGEDLWQHAGNI